jgi:hypothetical protein
MGLNSAMLWGVAAGNNKHRRKRKLSAFQKQIRFFTILSIVLACLLLGGLMWLMNHLGPAFH